MAENCVVILIVPADENSELWRNDINIVENESDNFCDHCDPFISSSYFCQKKIKLLTDVKNFNFFHIYTSFYKEKTKTYTSLFDEMMSLREHHVVRRSSQPE